jgi:hypothetical protein
MPVYVIRAGDEGPVKIGHGKDPYRRLASLQSGSAQPLILLGTLAGAAPEELRLHQQFAADRIFGEWFKFNPRMLDGLTPAPRIRPRRTRHGIPTNASIAGCRPGLPTDDLKILAVSYCNATGTSLNELGVRVGQPKVFKRLFAGHGCHSDTTDRAHLWFAANWPDGLRWPRSISRQATPDQGAT